MQNDNVKLMKYIVYAVYHPPMEDVYTNANLSYKNLHSVQLPEIRVATKSCIKVHRHQISTHTLGHSCIQYEPQPRGQLSSSPLDPAILSSSTPSLALQNFTLPLTGQCWEPPSSYSCSWSECSQMLGVLRKQEDMTAEPLISERVAAQIMNQIKHQNGSKPFVTTTNAKINQFSDGATANFLSNPLRSWY